MRGLILDFGGVLDGPGSDPEPLVAVVADLRARGVRTAILSNDPGGPGGAALRGLGGRVVDEVVLSGDVGLAKPDPRIFLHAARLLGVPPARCVFVDDLIGNVRGAVAVGMVGVHHVGADATVEELRILFDSEPGGAGGDGPASPDAGDG
ncbi:HAD-IA family hydrolase [Rhodococcus sp. NPDC058505]|uniref:HAD-IA family hydrolase n=1 Tax=Rhodococcus sp. NPDC058505 TaxID=3346531 RepID=UPI00364F8ED2